jgi:membrane-associated phospholipid phosphatase
MKFLFYKFWENLLEIFRGRHLLWQVLAIALTYILVVSGFDWQYFTFWNGSTTQSILFSAAAFGGLLPIFLPIIFYLVAKLKNNKKLKNVAFAIFQSELLGGILAAFYKAFTGRIQPPLHSASLLDISHNFNFGFLQHGVFWGWPSSHTAVAFAAAVTLFMLYPKNLAVRILALLLAFYIGIGVSMSIHWFSDFLAGAILGSLIGYIVGKSFLNRSKLLVLED